MAISIDLNKFFPKKFLIAGQKDESYYLCESRKKLIKATPEEKVRQGIIKFLKKECNVPQDMLEAEFALSKIEITSSLRADIVIFGLNEEKLKVPIAVIECKAQNKSLSQQVYNQLIEYDSILTPNFVGMTNGKEIYLEKYKWDSDEFVELNKIPTYEEMLSENDTLLSFKIKNHEWERCTDDIYGSLAEILDAYGNIILHNFTDENLFRPIINLCDTIYDTNSKFIPLDHKRIEIIEDLGNIRNSFGNAGGYDWIGLYRGFLIKEKNYYKTVYIGINEGYLLVAIDSEEKSHHSLQLFLNLENLEKKSEFNYSIYHNGALTVGKKGSLKRSYVISSVEKKAPHLIKNNKIFLGNVHITRDSVLNDKSVKEFLYNIIEYALIRDEIREE